MEKTILACDTCGKPATVTANIRFNGTKETWQIDLCAKDEADMKKKGRRAKRGRRAGSFVETPVAS
jgi:hypothetical protein